MLLRRCVVISLVLMWPASLCGQVVLEIESRDHRTSPPRSETSFVVSDGQQLATGLTSGTSHPEGGMIYRSSRREMVVLDHRDQTYMVLDAQAMQRLTGQLNQAMSQMQGQLQNVPANQRAMMEQLLGSQTSTRQASQRSPAEVRRTADSATCFGYPAVRYEVWREGRKQREMWVTDWRNVEGGREVAAVFVDMGEFTEQLLSALPSGGTDKFSDASIFTAMREIDGFPVGVREYGADGSIEQEWALRSAKRQRVDPTTFSPPTSYRRQ